MSPSSSRLIGVTAVGALVAGGLLVPAAASATTHAKKPQFHQVAASALQSAPVARVGHAAAGRVTATTGRAKVATNKAEQVLQRIGGLAGSATAAAPTTSLAVGTAQVMQAGWAGVRIYTKSTGKLISKSSDLKKVFGINNTGVTVTQATVVFDPVGKRFVLGAITNNAGTTGLVVRVSKKSTINAKSSSWGPPFGYADTDNVSESDVAIGVSADKLVLTANASDPGDLSVANEIVVVPKKLLFSATSTGPSGWLAKVNATYDGQTPAVNASSTNSAFVAVPYTTDFTVYTLTGPATSSAPLFSKSVMYPAKPLVDAPDVTQTGGDTLDLPSAIDSASVSWRKGFLWAALTVGCTPKGDSALRACLRVMKVATSGGVSLRLDQVRSAKGSNWFVPGIGIDGAGNPHVGFSWNKASGTALSTAVMAMRGSTWTPVTVVSKGNAAYNDGTPATTVPWAASSGGSVDPTSPWDAWFALARTTSAVPSPNWATSITRASLGKNVASTGLSTKRAKRGKKITVTAKLLRPQSKNAVAGLPVSLQFRAKGTSKWQTLGSAKTNGSGVKKWTIKVKKSGSFRTVGKAVKQQNGQGQLVAGVKGKPVVLTVT